MGFEGIRKTALDLIAIEEAKYVHPNMAVLDKKPISCIKYYSVNNLNSTESSGFGAISEWVGPESPVRYTRILNFVMFGFSESEKVISETEFSGFEYEQSNVSYILPGSIQPSEGDLFTLELTEGNILYMVTAVEEAVNNSKPMWRVDFESYITSDSADISEVDKQVVEELIFMVSNIGTQQSQLINTKDYNDSVELLNAIYKIQGYFIKTFYSRELSSFVCESDDGYIYSPLLTEFIKETELVYNIKMKLNIIVAHELILTRQFTKEFRGSIYGKMLNGKLVSSENLIFSKATYDGENPFSHFTKYQSDVTILGADTKTMQDISTFSLPSVIEIGDAIDLRPTSNTSFDDIDWYTLLDNINDLQYILSKLESLTTYDCDDLGAYIIVPLALYKLKIGNNKLETDDINDAVQSLFD